MGRRKDCTRREGQTLQNSLGETLSFLMQTARSSDFFYRSASAVPTAAVYTLTIAGLALCSASELV